MLRHHYLLASARLVPADWPASVNVSLLSTSTALPTTQVTNLKILLADHEGVYKASGLLRVQRLFQPIEQVKVERLVVEEQLIQQPLVCGECTNPRKQVENLVSENDKDWTEFTRNE